MDKKELRKEYRKRRDELYESDEFGAINDAITANIMALPEFEKADTILSFMSFSSEFDTLRLMEESLKRDKKVFVPRITDQNEMIFLPFDEKTEFSVSKYGIKEPVIKEAVSESEDSDRNILIVTPALCVDRSFYRLGYGGGYYDRFISLLRSAFKSSDDEQYSVLQSFQDDGKYSVLKNLRNNVNFCQGKTLDSVVPIYSGFVLDNEIPHDTYDMQVDIIVTERETLFRKQSLKESIV